MNTNKYQGNNLHKEIVKTINELSSEEYKSIYDRKAAKIKRDLIEKQGGKNND